VATVLILSEIPEDRRVYEHVLERLGYNYVSVSSHQDTLSHLQSSSIDVLFMIGLHGDWDFYEQLKSDPKLCGIPVIIYSGWGPSNVSPNPSDYGDTLFTRPMPIGEFVKKVQELTGIEQE
jgi:DNA-binding NtrC family response regulator